MLTILSEDQKENSADNYKSQHHKIRGELVLHLDKIEMILFIPLSYSCYEEVTRGFGEETGLVTVNAPLNCKPFRLLVNQKITSIFCSQY